jgi:uncharacterized membrane protein
MSEDLQPHLVAVLALLALLPHGIYAASTGMFTPVTLVVGVVNILLITGMLVLIFGPEEATNGSEAAAPN